MAQDEALSRLKPGFEFPWGHKKSRIERGSFFLTVIPTGGRCSNSRGGTSGISEDTNSTDGAPSPADMTTPTPYIPGETVQIHLLTENGDLSALLHFDRIKIFRKHSDNLKTDCHAEELPAERATHRHPACREFARVYRCHTPALGRPGWNISGTRQWLDRSHREWVAAAVVVCPYHSASYPGRRRDGM